MISVCPIVKQFSTKQLTASILEVGIYNEPASCEHDYPIADNPMPENPLEPLNIERNILTSKEIENPYSDS